MINFNINHYVFVRLTERGHQVHRRSYEQLGIPAPEIKEDVDGWSRWQLWDLMSIFGASCFMGPKSPFETTIRIETDSVLTRQSND